MGRSVESLEILRVVGDGNSSSPSSSEWFFRELDDVMLQTQTRIWLGEVLHRRLDECLDISDMLADGEFLFEVSRVVWKMFRRKSMELEHIKQYEYEPFTSRRSGGRYMPYSNVDSFLKICKILGLTSVDLFSPSDVVEKKDTRKVCMCIRTLAKRARLRQLNVPDFDIVTCTVPMPTDMVGCIRRSLEVGIGCCNSYIRESIKGRQRSSVASCARYCDSYSDDSDDADQSDTSSTHGSYYALSHMNYDLESSPEISSAKRDCGLQQNPLQLEQEKHRYAQYQFESKSLCESVGSLCSELVECDNQLDIMSSPSGTITQIHLNDKFSLPKNATAKYTLECNSLDFNCASDAEDFMDHSVPERSYMADQMQISEIFYGIDISNPNSFDGESIFESYPRSGSDRSTASIFSNGFENEQFDGNNVELSSTTTMSSTSGPFLKLNFDDQVGEGDGFRTLQLPESRNQADLHTIFVGGIVRKIEKNVSENVHGNQCRECHSIHPNPPYSYHQLDQEGQLATATNRNGSLVSSSQCALSIGLPNEGFSAGADLKSVVTSSHPSSHNCLQVEERIDDLKTGIIAAGIDVPHTVAKDITDVHSSSLSPHLIESMSVIHSSMTRKCSEDMCRTGHQVYTNDDEDLYSEETERKRGSQGDGKNEKVDNLSMEKSNKRVDHRVEQANHIHKRWSVLKSVVGGTTVVGMVFLLLRHRLVYCGTVVGSSHGGLKHPFTRIILFGPTSGIDLSACGSVDIQTAVCPLAGRAIPDTSSKSIIHVNGYSSPKTTQQEQMVLKFSELDLYNGLVVEL